MQDIDTRDETGDSEDEEEEVGAEEIGGEQGHFDNLDDVFSSRLREGGRSESSSVPCINLSQSRVATTMIRGRTPTSPPSSIRLVVFELSRDTESDEDLEDSSLNAARRTESAICDEEREKK